MSCRFCWSKVRVRSTPSISPIQPSASARARWDGKSVSISPNRFDLERQPRQDVVEELRRGILVRAGIDPQDAEPSAVADRGVLVEPPRPVAGVGGDRFDELDVDLQLVVRSYSAGSVADEGCVSGT